MVYMIVEQYRDGGAKAVYRRLEEKGRMMPDGLAYVDSWVAADLERCFQVVECEDARLIEEWTREWDDLIDFEIVPVMSSEDAENLALAGEGSSAHDASSERESA